MFANHKGYNDVRIRNDALCSLKDKRQIWQSYHQRHVDANVYVKTRDSLEAVPTAISLLDLQYQWFIQDLDPNTSITQIRIQL